MADTGIDYFNGTFWAENYWVSGWWYGLEVVETPNAYKTFSAKFRNFDFEAQETDFEFLATGKIFTFESDKKTFTFYAKNRAFVFEAKEKMSFNFKAKNRIFNFEAKPMAENRFEKDPDEQYTITIDFSGENKLPDGATIDSATVTAIDLSDLSDASGTVLSGAATTTTNSVSQVVTGGTENISYKLTFTVTLAASAGILEEDVFMDVLER